MVSSYSSYVSIAFKAFFHDICSVLLAEFWHFASFDAEPQYHGAGDVRARPFHKVQHAAYRVSLSALPVYHALEVDVRIFTQGAYEQRFLTMFTTPSSPCFYKRATGWRPSALKLHCLMQHSWQQRQEIVTFASGQDTPFIPYSTDRNEEVPGCSVKRSN